MKTVLTSIFAFSLTASAVSAQEYIDMSGFNQINQAVQINQSVQKVQTISAPRTNTQAEKKRFCNIDGGESMAVKTYNIMINSNLNYNPKHMKEARRTYYHYRNACNDTSSAKTTEKYYRRFVTAVDRAWNSVH